MAALLTILEEQLQPDGTSRRSIRHRRHLEPGQRVRIGRDSAVGIGVDPLDRKVSGRAVVVSLEDGGWRVAPANRRGVDLFQWGQPWQPDIGDRTLCWPRVGLSVKGDETAYRHWVLLEDASMPTSWVGGRAPTDTEPTEALPRLAPGELAAVREVFDFALGWPPRFRQRPRTAEEAAQTLLKRVVRAGEQEDMGEGGVRARLRRAQAKSGLTADKLTSPSWVYALVRRGLITPEPHDVDGDFRSSTEVN
jgi:hypothetical protein